MALPKIAPQSTTSSLNLASTPKVNMPNIYEVYPAWPPTTNATARTNPLRPSPPARRTVMLETGAPHWDNDFRTMRMKQREYNRYHNAWSKYYYGSPAEQESYRSYTRSVLKQQMQDKWALQRHQRVDKVRESDVAVEQDRKSRMEDAHSSQTKRAHLTSFRDENKKLMEWAWTDNRKRKTQTDLYDREQLRYNPINWSQTLK